jgi:hypothetical protein
VTDRVFGSVPSALGRVQNEQPLNSRSGVVADKSLGGQSNAPASGTRQTSRADSNTSGETQNLRQQTSPTPLMK